MTKRDRIELRRAAGRLFDTGASRARVAEELGVSRSTAGRWYRLWQERGSRGMVRGTPPGRRRRLDSAAGIAIHRALTRSPRDFGFAFDRWSLASIAVLIERLTGIRYHRRHVGRLLLSLGWVVPPVGRSASEAFRRESVTDPEGNPVLLLGR